MKLFIKEHLSFVFLYLITFLGLPIVIEKLDGFGNHYLNYHQSRVMSMLSFS